MTDAMMEEVTDEVDVTTPLPSTNANGVPQSKSPSSENPSTVPLSDNVSIGSAPDPLEETQSLALQDVDLNPSNSNGESVLCDHSTVQVRDHSCDQLDNEKTYSEDSGDVSHRDNDVDQTSACLSGEQSIEGGSGPDGQLQDNTRDRTISDESSHPTMETPTNIEAHPTHPSTLDSDCTPSATEAHSHPILSGDEPINAPPTTVETPHDTSTNSNSDTGVPPSKTSEEIPPVIQAVELETPPVTQPVGGAELETPPVTQPVGGAELETPPVTQPVGGAELETSPVTKPVGGAEPETSPVTKPMGEMILDRTGLGELSESSQTSFVNEYALDGDNSPTYEVDRSLEQFSEILLDSDSDSEVRALGAGEATGAAEESEAQRKKAAKKVRFADEVSEKIEVGGPHGHVSPPPPPSSLPDHPAPDHSSKHPGVPITPSPTSPKHMVPHPQYTVDELINGVELPAEYLGSTPIIQNGIGSMKSARMFQAQQAVQLIKDPESDSRPRFAVKLKISTGAVKIADSKTDVDLMDHPLHTITYVADIDHVLVIMAHILPQRPPPSQDAAPQTNGEAEEEGEYKYIPKMTCHVLDSSNARQAAMVIGQAFSAAYKQFLRSSGISEQHLEQAEYAHILNAQSVPQLEVESLGDRNKIKKLTLAKHKNDIMGMMVMESGYGSAIPACVLVHISKTGSASKSGLLNIGDHIISINGVNLVGIPRKACLEQIKKCRQMNVVHMEVCSCPAVVDVTIVRPDLKYQLGFSIHEGMICSLVRGSIAERSGVRVGHRIIDINGTSTVGMKHSDVVHLLSSTVGDLHIRMMPDIMYKLLTGKLQPEYY